MVENVKYSPNIFDANNPYSCQEDISVAEGRAHDQETLCHERCPTSQSGLEEGNKSLPIIACTNLTVESILSVHQGNAYQKIYVPRTARPPSAGVLLE